MRSRTQSRGGASASWRARNRSIQNAPQEVSGNHDALDFRRAFADLADLGVTHHPLDRIVLRIAIPTVNLDRLDRSAHRKLGAEQLCNCRFFSVWPLVLCEPGSVEHEVLPRLDLRCHVGELELDALEIRDRAPELLSVGSISERLLERAFCNSKRE